MRIYLAGPSAALPRVIEAAREIEAAGHIITEPWWVRITEAAERGWHSDAVVPQPYMRESAKRNEDGISEADRVVILCRESGGLSSGCAYELGFAKSRPWAGRIYIVGDHRNHVGIWTLTDAGVSVVAVRTVKEALR